MNAATPRFSVDRALIFLALGMALTAIFWPRSQSAAQRDLQLLRDELASLRGSIEAADKQREAQVAATEAVSPDGVTIRQVHEWAWGLEQRLVELEDSLEQSRMAASASPGACAASGHRAGPAGRHESASADRGTARSAESIARGECANQRCRSGHDPASGRFHRPQRARGHLSAAVRR